MSKRCIIASRFVTGVVLTAMLLGRVAANDTPPTPEQTEFFETRVRPLLVKRCHECHGPDEQEAGLRLDSRSSLLKGGDTGPAIFPGDAKSSELIRAIGYDPDGYQMPPDGKLPQREIDILTKWVEIGAPWPGAADGPSEQSSEFNLAERAERWSFGPLTRPVVPQPPDADWCRNPIDRFLLAKLQTQGLSPAERADSRTLLRRACFDITGLPPTVEQVERSFAHEAPDAWPRLVEELLASPHFGERWGRHWMDLVRYADSRGHEFDHDVANAWHYRDYIVQALNDNVPYNQLVVEHIAGDLLVAESQARGQRPTGSDFPLRLLPLTGANQSILATGFWFLGEWVHSPVDIRGDEAERFANMIDVYSKTFLGLTVACARCHDHKFDPITTKDFYALQGYLQSTAYRQAHFETETFNQNIGEELQAIRVQATREMTNLLCEAVRPGIESVDQYLLAAYEQMRTDRTSSDSLDAGANQTAVATSLPNAAAGLDPNRLQHWVTHLRQAANDADDPFARWARLCTGQLASAQDVVIAAVGDTPPSRNSQQPVEGDATAITMFSSDQMSADSPAIMPVEAGEIFPYADAEHPIDGLAERDCQWFDPAFDRLSATPESTREPGAFGPLHPSGRTIRTPTFEITGGHIEIDVLGPVTTYVAVDSHHLIRGPLHGTLVKDHSDDEQWRTVHHDVSRYQGHRAHIEIIGQQGKPFAVHKVVEQSKPSSKKAVPLPPDIPHVDLSKTPNGTPLTIPILAGRYRQHFEMALLGNPDTDAAIPKRDVATANWVLQHPELFGLDNAEYLFRLQKASATFVDQRRQLRSRSRLHSATAPVMSELSGENERVFIRGNWKKPGEEVPRRFLEVFSGQQMIGRTDYPSFQVARTAKELSTATGVGIHTEASGRLQLAHWMVDPQATPILPRVIVNRIWQHYFGMGIVATPDDFGEMGQPPTHPELLDWLASELVEKDWSLKHIHRLILTSAAYRMSSAADDHAAEDIDPGNRLLHRMNVKRLEGEAIRDAVLTLSGRLDERMYGPSIPVHLTPFMEGRGRPNESGPVDGDGRRSVYIAVRRNFPDPFFQAFDMPNPHTTVGQRTVSNVPAQALAMMNNPLIVGQSRRWAERLLNDDPAGDVTSRLRRAYLNSVSREPSAEELAAGETFLRRQAAEFKVVADDPMVWADLCHVLLNAKEFLFVR